jgi:hypothetical protein
MACPSYVFTNDSAVRAEEKDILLSVDVVRIEREY